MLLRFLLALPLALILTVGPRSEAATVYSQELVNPYAGFGSNDPPASAANQRIADDFVLGADTSIASVTWYGLFTTSNGVSYGGGPALFSVRFFADVGTGAAPALDPFMVMSVAAASSPTGISTTGDQHAVFEYQANLPSALPLSAGQYWISIVEGDALSTDVWEWAPTQMGVGTADAVRRVGDPLSGWIAVGFPSDLLLRRNLAFSLDDSPVPVPEPVTLVLLGAACLGFATQKRCCRR